MPDYTKLGLALSAFIMITVNYDKIKSQEEVARQIKKLPNVDEVCIVTGDMDILVKVRTHTIEELNDVLIRRLRSVTGVDKTRTSVVLSEIN